MYEQDFEREYQEFNAAINLFVNILKFKDRDLVETCEQVLMNLMGSKYTQNIMNAALFQLAGTAPDTCQWIWQNFPYLDACITLKEYVVMLAVQKLISQGFVLGQDFSTTADGELLVNQNARAVLMQSISDADRVFVTEILDAANQ
ncbi:hypothetical protein WA1_22720 [Scytonema hofmannii PCC 7110]|uniref:Uncharacterized protein n=1 Tax=Scytonema hofmannii PCC 7110 TaxID=128403 RepID=A0A139X9B6_9CYAN|nr:hypothetical protein [Scytonema hofmannii]KYC41281.1 hypothetical protein WA1_22720 [Scytonema hofmannii PCC 7110]